MTKPPELTAFVEATYPEEARKLGLTGEVRLLIEILADGKVGEVKVVGPVGHGFDEAAVGAVKRFSFTPAEIDGKPAPVQIEYLYKFVLREPPAEPSPAPRPLPVSLRGVVVERGSKKPLAGAVVRCAQFEEVVAADAEGRFELHVPPGSCSVEVTAAGHRVFKTQETLVEGEVVEVRYFLMPRAYGLFETVIRGEREKKEVARRTLEREEIEKVPGSLGDPVRVIQNLPGVARAPYMGGELIVRGASPGDTGSYMDGVEIPMLYHFMGGPSVINPEFVDKIDFYPGGFSARYGRATGGIIDVSTRRPETERLRGSLEIDTLNSAAFVAAPLPGGWSVAAAGRRSYIDVLLPPVMNALVSDDPRVGTVAVLPRYYDYQLRVDNAVKGSPHRFTAMFFGSDDETVVAASGGAVLRSFDLDLHTQFNRLRLQYSYQSEPFTLTVMPFGGRDFTVVDVQSISFDIHDTIGGVRVDGAYKSPQGHVARAGLDFHLRSTSYLVKVPLPSTYREFPGEAPVREADTFDRVIQQFDWGAYAELEFVLGKLRLVPGVRYDLFRLHGHTREDLDPRFIARYLLTPTTALKGSVGLYRQPPAAEDLDPLIGNPNLGLISSFQTSLGVEQKLTQYINVDLVGFFNRRFDVQVSSNRILVAADGSMYSENYTNDGLGRAYGLELMLRHEISPRFFGWLAYTLSRNEQRRRGGDSTYRPGEYDETHILTLVGQYKVGWGIEVGARFRLVSGRPMTPYIGSRFDADRDSYRSIAGEPGSERTKLFHQLDIRLDKTFVFDWWTFGIYLDVMNVYNAQNSEGVLWDYRYRAKTDIPGLPFLPTLGIKGVF